MSRTDPGRPRTVTVETLNHQRLACMLQMFNNRVFNHGGTMAPRIDGIEALIGLQRASPSLASTTLPQSRVSSGPFDQILTNALARRGLSAQVQPLVQPGNGYGSVAFPQSSPSAEEQKFRQCLDFVFAHEGSRYVSKDGGRESSKYGILQSTAEEYGYTGSIKDLTKEQAEGIYRKIWDKSGAKDLPPSLSLVHFDTYVNSPAAAKKFLKQSDGDAETYIRARGLRYNRLVSSKPLVFAKYLKGWTNRLKDLSNMVAQYGGVSRA
jgi:hypothetical protein